MTETNVTENSIHRPGVRRMKKANLRIDMTPMVDLGFLLISFFIFTTEISKPAATDLYMPHDGRPIDVAESKTLTVLLSNNKVFYYFGNIHNAKERNQVFQTSFNEMIGLGNIIRQKQQELEKLRLNKNELMVIIKPAEDCYYKSLIIVSMKC
jgi:biopolymer transport protein ExbD